MLERLSILDVLKKSFAPSGELSPEGLELHQMHFVGGKAWFTDSSDGEKVDFLNELTFPHPEKPGETLWCPWHGKEKSHQFRIHFSFPIVDSAPLYVVYVGPKLTKR